MKYRIGHGYDVHRLEQGCCLTLGGVKITYERELLGHSDADVLLHAIIDALLGACALGDIGKMFPDTDSAYRGISSVELLKRAYDKINENGYFVSNIDATVVAQAPRLTPYIDEMRSNIAKTLRADVSAISIKATTEECLGFTGAGEGIAAHAVCLLERSESFEGI